MRLSSRLLLVGLVTLVLPWAGCQYLRDVETALRQGRVEALAASVTAVASGLSADDLGASMQPARFQPGRTPADDIYAHFLERRPVLDGFVDDWGLDPGMLRRVEREGVEVAYAAAFRRGSVYLFLEVTDDQVVYGESDRSDRVRLRIGSPETGGRDLIFAPRAPGTIYPLVPGGETSPDVEGNWQPTSVGYSLEIRLPARKVADRLGFIVTDYRNGQTAPTVGTLPSLASEPGWLIHRRAGLDQALSRSALPGARLKIVDSLGYLIADTGVPTSRPTTGESRILRRLVRLALAEDRGLERLSDPTGDRVDLAPFREALETGTAAGRFRSESSRRVTLVSARRLNVTPPAQALLIAEQDTEAILSSTDRAATRLVVASLAASLSAVLLLLGFAAWLSWRIRRLSSATSRSLTGSGEIRPDLPEGGSADELGDLSRSFSRLLGQVGEYNAYLKTLGQKLTHELRTPMAVVLTSLENLQADPAGTDAPVYIRRATEGLQRLQAMVSALGAATRVEQSMAAADQELFDLSDVAGELFRAYAETHAGRRIDIQLPDAPCRVQGSPELIAQMLDKLFENALDFCPPGGLITLSLERDSQSCRLRVGNSGSRLEEELGDQLFESLVSARDGDGETPHLGLGLYIARLIARHHRGGISARNLPAGGGVEFVVEIPLAGPGSI